MTEAKLAPAPMATAAATVGGGGESEAFPGPTQLWLKEEQLNPTAAHNGFIHMYRGELGRQVAYRSRLDGSTSWAVTVGGTMTVLSLNNDNISHWFHGIIILFVLVFLVFEVRRYLFYNVSQYRVRMLEQGYYGLYFAGQKAIDPDWERKLWESLRYPKMQMSWGRAALVRLQRNYLLIVTAVLFSWSFKASRQDVQWYVYLAVWGGFSIIAIPIWLLRLDRGGADV